MKVYLYDTETSRDLLWKEPSEHPDQPHMVQYVGVLFDDQTGEELDYFAMFSTPEGWQVDDEFAAKYHGITNERLASEQTEPEHKAIQHFEAMIEQADRVTGYNVQFDLRVMRIAMIRSGRGEGYADLVRERLKPLTHDVMRQASPVCRLPPTEKMKGGFKLPKLEEAVQVILGETLADAHDARADVLATKRLYEYLNAPATA